MSPSRHTPLSCAVARRRLAMRESGLLGAEGAERLERHLAGCDACRRESAIDRALSIELAALRVDYPHSIDVRERVLRGLDERRQPAAWDTVAPGQLGLAAAVALAASIVVAISTGLGLDAITGGARQLWTVIDTAGDALVPMARAALELAGIPLRAVLTALASFSTAAAPLAERWLPSAIALTALAYVAMGATMARVIARGFVAAPAIGRHRSTA